MVLGLFFDKVRRPMLVVRGLQCAEVPVELVADALEPVAIELALINLDMYDTKVVRKATSRT